MAEGDDAGIPANLGQTGDQGEWPSVRAWSEPTPDVAWTESEGQGARSFPVGGSRRMTL